MIYINDKAYPFEETVLLSDLFISLELEIAKGVAVALNNRVIPRAEWNNCKVNPDDKLILIRATQGG